MFYKNSINMKNTFIICLLFASINVFSQSTLDGVWNTGNNNTIIEVTESNGTITGKIKSSDKADIEIGKVILKDLKEEDDKWVGSIYAHKRKQWYDVEIYRKNNLLELEVSTGFFSKSLTWKEATR